MKKSSKLLAVSIIVIIVVSAVVAVYVTRSQVAPQISLAPSSFVAQQGLAITFTVFGLESNGIVTLYFGDGHEANTTSTVTRIYQTPGRYLVGAQESVNGQSVSSTFNALQIIQVTPRFNESLGSLVSVPAVSFDTARNPSAPIVQAGESVFLTGGYLEPPSGTNVTITSYVWDFGNGATKTVPANSTSLNPADNPVTTSFTQPGLYPITLTLVTENSTSMATYQITVAQTVAVASPSQPYALFLYAGTVPNPSVINVAEYVPGGPITFDPDEATDGVSEEITWNIYAALVVWNGSSTTNFIPMVAAQLPSVSNGEIALNYTSYTFQIRSGMKFSNGDPVTPYDVWYSVVRGALVAPWGALPNSGIPGSSPMNSPTDTTDYNAIMTSVAYSNSSNTVTFRFVKPMPPDYLLDRLADGICDILDAKWLEQVGAGISFTPAGFYSYQTEANPGVGDNLEVQWAPVASGPYMIQTYTPGQSISLVPNPGFNGVPGFPELNNTVVIQWVGDAGTAYSLFRSGQADILEGVLGTSLAYDQEIEHLVADGRAAAYSFPSVYGEYFYFNLAVNETALKAEIGSQYHIPSDYFTNLDIRKAFAYAFNYTNYVDVLQGNEQTGIDFGDAFAGTIAPGVLGYVPENQLQNVPIYNLTYAKQLLERSGEYNTSINIPVIIWPGDPVDFAAAQMWAAAINSIDPNIVMTPVSPPTFPGYTNWVYPTYGPDPIALGSFTGGPAAHDAVDGPYLGSYGLRATRNSWSASYLNSTGHRDEAETYSQLQSLIQQADSTTNTTLAAQDYKQVEQTAVDLYMYVYLSRVNSFWVVKPYITGYQSQISYEMNPVVGGAEDGWYYWWVKGCENPQACSGRNMGP